MKRLNLRYFRETISEQTQEPVEVTRYGRTVGYWVPIALTTEPSIPAKRVYRMAETEAKRVTEAAAKIAWKDWLKKAKELDDSLERLAALKKEE